MTRLRLFSLVALCALLVTPLSALAQGGDQEMQTYTSPDGYLTFSYPADWVAQESSFLYGATVANSQDALDAIQSEDITELPAGAVYFNIVLASSDTFESFGMEMEEDMTPEEMLQVFLDFVTTQGEGEGGEEEMAEPGMEATEDASAMATEEPVAMGTEQAPDISEIQTVDFEDGRQAAWATVKTPGSDDAYILYQVADGVFAVNDIFTPTGELTQDLIDLAVQISQSVQFTGDLEDLAVAMPSATVEPSDVNPSTLDGNALVDERCTSCHTRDRVDEEHMDEAGWTATVDRMIGYGADLDSAERQAVIDYLVATN